MVYVSLKGSESVVSITLAVAGSFSDDPVCGEAIAALGLVSTDKEGTAPLGIAELDAIAELGAAAVGIVA